MGTTTPWGVSVNRFLVMGLFALLVSLVTLYRVMREREDTRLYRLSRAWGRRAGRALFFVLNIALPALFGVMFFCQGVVHLARDGMASDLALGLPILRTYLPGTFLDLIPPLQPLFPLDLLVP